MAISAINAGLSALRAYDSALGSSGHNTANALTQGFQPQTVQFREASNGGVSVKISQASKTLSEQAQTETGPSATDLAGEITNSLQYKIGFEVAAKLVQTSNDMLDSLLKLR